MTVSNYTLHNGKSEEQLKQYADNTFDAVVCDPPYLISFLDKGWDDKDIDLTPVFKECLRVLKPGGYLLAFSAARTYHKLAYSVELAGFEIRDQLMWIYGSGFPKAQDIGKAIQKRIGVEEIRTSYHNVGNSGLAALQKQCDRADSGVDLGLAEHSIDPVCTSPIAKEWEGWKTALKPAHEPIVMARKPYKGSTIDNVLKNGLGAMNIDDTRIPWADEAEAIKYEEWKAKYPASTGGETFDLGFGNDESWKEQKKKKSDRPAGVKMRPKGSTGFEVFQGHKEWVPADEDAPILMPHDAGRYPSNVIGEVAEEYQKYFYCPKVSRKERHVGFGDDSESIIDMVTEMGGYFIDKDGNKKDCPSEDSNMYWTPHLGVTRIHGVKEVIRAWRETNNIVSTRIGNNHPTVKPQALMDYLIRLVTPPSTPTLQRKVLDPFMGSGSTGMAAVKLGHHFTGCDLDEKYIEISKTRIEAWNTEPAEVISERISAKVKKAREKRLDPNLFGEPE